MREIARFGSFLLIPARQALFKAGQRLRLGSRAFEILVLLVERAGEIVSKQELMERVWPKTYVEEGNLRVHIAALRKVLIEDDAADSYIVNVAGRGYRFSGAVFRDSDERDDKSAAPRSRSSRNPLPTLRSWLIGRDEIVAELESQMRFRKFVTLTGPGGIGKTSVALAVAAAIADRYPDGVRFIDLGSLASSELVATSVASSIDLHTLSRSPEADMVAVLSRMQTLFVLDTCEPVIDAVAALAEQIGERAPANHILATSREPLRARGERVVRLPPLDMPMRGAALSAKEALAFSAVRLFAEQASSMVHDFDLADADVPYLIEICHRLDGNPLAIELAAARVDAFGIRGIATELIDRFSVLTGGRRTALRRHQGLRATLDWSYALLTEFEQRLLRRLSVFRASFTLESAVEVSADADLDRNQAAEGLWHLVEKSLVVANMGPEPLRYSLLDTTRAYAADALDRSGETEALERRHARRLVTLFQEAEADWERLSKAQWMSIYEDKIDDIRAALRHAFSPFGDVLVGIALVALSWPLWFALSLQREYWQRVEQSLSLIGGTDLAGGEIEVKLLISAKAAIFNTRGPTQEVALVCQRALGIATALGATEYQLQALWGLAGQRYSQGDYNGAHVFVEQHHAIAEASGDPAAGLVRDRMMALGLHNFGRHAEARPFAERAVIPRAKHSPSAYTSLHEYDTRVASRSHLARVLWAQGFADRAALVVEEGVQQGLAIGYPPPLCYVLAYAACPIAFWRGDLVAARRYVDLLLRHTGNLSYSHWQTWSRCHEMTLRFLTQDTQGIRSVQASAVQEVANNPLAADLVGTFHPELASGLAIGRAEAGLAGWCTPELLRAKAVMLGPDSAGEAESVLGAATRLAIEHGAGAWRLRAAASLAQLLYAQGRRREARKVLNAAIEPVTEGFETKDLKEAFALLRILE